MSDYTSGSTGYEGDYNSTRAGGVGGEAAGMGACGKMGLAGRAEGTGSGLSAVINGAAGIGDEEAGTGKHSKMGLGTGSCDISVSATANVATGRAEGKAGSGAEAVSSSGSSSEAMGMGNGNRTAVAVDGSEEHRASRAPGVSMMVARGGGRWTGAAGSNEAGRDMARSVSSHKGYTVESCDQPTDWGSVLLSSQG